MSELLESVRKAREQAFSAKSEIEQRIEQVKKRIYEVCWYGTIPFDEAFPAWLSAFEHYADEGARRFESALTGYARPNDPHPKTGSLPNARGHTSEAFRADSRGDQGAVFAHLHRETIVANAREYFEAHCAESNVPPKHERAAELERLSSELSSLESQRDDLEDELSRLIGTEPSDRTKKERIEDDNELRLEAINRPIREWNEKNVRAPRDGERQVKVTVNDE